MTVMESSIVELRPGRTADLQQRIKAADKKLAKLDRRGRRRRRTGAARALALEPRALFLDELFANVDADSRPLLRAAVRTFCQRSGCTLVLATQNLADVAVLCRTALVLENGSAAELLAVDAIGRTQA
jgi:ABC-type sulfate/molybdate transport systems ATPase subunit